MKITDKYDGAYRDTGGCISSKAHFRKPLHNNDQIYRSPPYIASISNNSGDSKLSTDTSEKFCPRAALTGSIILASRMP